MTATKHPLIHIIYNRSFVSNSPMTKDRLTNRTDRRNRHVQGCPRTTKTPTLGVRCVWVPSRTASVVKGWCHRIWYTSLSYIPNLLRAHCTCTFGAQLVNPPPLITKGDVTIRHCLILQSCAAKVPQWAKPQWGHITVPLLNTKSLQITLPSTHLRSAHVFAA